MVSSDFWHTHRVIILCFFCAQLSGNYLKIAFFKKGVQNWVFFFNFLCFRFNFWKLSFLGLLKHYKNRGFSWCWCFTLLKETEGKKNDNWNFWILFFCPKMAVSWRITFFPKMPCSNPYFYRVFWVRVFWAKLLKKAIFGHPQKRKILTDNWKALFWYFCVFLLFLSFSFLFLFFCLFFLGGFKGQVRWPEGPPHLALNPPYNFIFLCFSFFFFVVFLFVCFGGFECQVR